MDTVDIPINVMKPLVEKTFAAVGCPHDEAQRIAHYLIHANLTGHDSHGVLRVPRYVEWVKNGRVKAGQQVEVVMDAGAMAILDGHQGFGQTVGPQAAQHGITKALEHGVAVVALRNAGHLGRIGDYAEAAAAAGLASIHCVNVRGSLLVAPFGGVERRLSTAPFAAGVPVPGGEPVILDFATSAVAEGKALVAARGGKPLPMGTLITAEGELSNDPLELYGEITEGVSPNPRSGSGALRTMGDHKGSGLSIMMELLGGALTGCGTAGPPPKEFANGMLSVYMEVARFDDLGNYADEVRNYIDFVKNSRPADPQAPVLVPGDKERALKRERESNGLPLSVQSWDDIVGAARAASVTDAEISELINQI